MYTLYTKISELGRETLHGGIHAIIKEIRAVIAFAGHVDGHLCRSLNKGKATANGKPVLTTGRARTD